MTVTIGKIPVYQALVSDEDTGMMKISLVDDPAVMSNFLAFDSTRKVMLYEVADEEKRLVRGVVMRADFPIYRYDESFGEYYVIYKADTIRTMAEKYLVEGRQNNINLMHEDGSDVEGVQMVQYFIKDSAAGIAPANFDEIADGSLFAEFHVVNDDVWDAVKAGTYKGFSLEGVFNLIPEEDKDSVQQIVDALDGKFNNNQHKTKMSKKKKIIAAIARLLAAYGNVTTDKGILAWDGDEDLKAGDTVYLEDEDGNRTTPSDGDYKTDDGKVVRVADGKVSEIVDDAAEVGDEFSTKSTDKGDLSWDGSEDLKAGDAVYVEDENGEKVAAPDGDYKTEDGKIIVVKDGVVSEIKDDEAEVAPQEDQKMARAKRVSMAFSESYDEKEQKMYDAIKASGFQFEYGYIAEAGDDYAILGYYGNLTVWEDRFVRFDVSWGADGMPVVSNPMDVRRGFVPFGDSDPAEPTTAEPAAPAGEEEMAKMQAEMSKVKSEKAALEAEVARLQKLSGAKPAHEEVKEKLKYAKTGVKGLDTLSRIMSAEPKN